MTTYTGNNGNNTINGSNGDDIIYGLGGNDDLSGGNGNDAIFGGGDDDEIDGGNGNDSLSGDGGDDEIDGGNGNDVIDGGDDDDTILGGNGNDIMFGGAGNDTLFGENGNDQITGGGGDDVIDGGNGFDTAYYSGPIAEYSFFSAGGYLHIVHLGGAGADGHDQLKKVERLVFADQVINVGSGNNVPVAVDDHVFINEDTGTYSSGAASVKDNDFDFDGDALTVTPGVFVGTYGTLTLNANGTYSYTLFASAQALAQGQNVTDSFNYTVSDNDGSDTGTLVFHIAGVNDAPNADPDSASAGENQTILINVLANDDDIDNGAVLTVTGASAPAGQGTASVVGNQVQFDPGTDFDDLAVGQTEIVVISYSISDEHGATDSSTVTVTVTGTNDGPVANPDTNSGDPVVESGVNPGNTPFPGDASAAGNVLANDTDVDTGDTKTVAAVNGSALNVGTAVAGTYGSVTIASDGSYTYTLDNADPDTNALAQGASVNDVFSYTVQDSSGATATTSLTITITGTNDAPVAVADSNGGDPVVESGVNPGNTPFPGDASAAGNVLANDTDVDSGDTKTVAAVNGSAVNVGTAVAGTYGSVTIASDGSYTYTLDNADPDTNALAQGASVNDVFSYTVTDANGATATTSLTITITGTNDAPTIDAGGTDDSGSVTELPNNDPNENAFTHSDSGTVDFDDVDVPDTHSASFTPQGGGYLGTFTLDPVDQLGDSVGWDFSVEDSDLDFLDEGETLTQTYTIEIEDANGATVTQDVTITLTGAGDGPQTEWYIDNSAVGSANTGTQADPYTSIAAFNAAQGTVGGPQVGHTVYLLAGTGLYAEADGINLLDDQILTGVASGPLRPTIEAAAGDGLNVAQNNNVSGLDIGNTSGADIADSGGSVGTLTIADVGTSGTGQVIDVDQGGTLNVTLNGAESLGSSGGAVDLAGVGGSFTVTGATTITGIHSGGGIDITGASVAATFGGGGIVSTADATAVNFVGNSGALAIGGGLAIVTTSGTGLNATGGGTVTATGAGNTIVSASGTALNISNTTIGAGDVTFQSISSGTAASSTATGIILDTTGSLGGLHVTGTGVAGSGGTIQHKTGADGSTTTGIGIFLNDTDDVQLSYMQLNDFDNNAIRGNAIVGLVLNEVDITGTNGSIAGPLQEYSVYLVNLTGAANILNSEISGGFHGNIAIDNQSGTLNLNFLNNNVHDTHAASTGDGFNLEAETSAVILANISNNVFDDNDGDDFNLSLINNAQVDLTFNNNDLIGGAGKLGGGIFVLGAAFNGSLEYDISGNDVQGANQGGAIFVSKGSGTAAFSGQIVDNVVGNPAVPNSGSLEAIGIYVGTRGAGGSHTTLIDGNEVYQYEDRGIVVEAGEGSPTLVATVTGNTVSDFADPINSLHGIHFNFGILGADNPQITIDVRDNLIGTAGNEPQGGVDFRMRAAASSDVFIAGYTGGNSAANAQAFIDGQNPAGTSFQVTLAGTATYNNGPAVPLPPPNLPELPPAPLLAAAAPSAPAVLGDAAILSQAEAELLTAAAIQRWAEAGATAEQIAAMHAVSVTVSDMAGLYVGSSSAGLIHLDSDGAGHGWFVDATPGEDSEYEGSGSRLTADAGGAADGRIDALTVILHELGHRIGLGDDYHAASQSDLMHGYIDAGERRLPDGMFEAAAAASPAGGVEWAEMPLAHPDMQVL